MKTFTGIVTSIKMKDTVVVEVTRRTPHPLYKKLLKRSSKFKVAAKDHTLAVGNMVTIGETRPIAKQVHFKIVETKVKEHKK
ncbi:MAG: 30S ribosomal protein S17 [Candidatus Levybacteria bacterium]|nr:30S ribosomal protein S17 [Candidatus Levybacteria bacterium]